MPKRARCPRCGRLFSRNDLDQHIQKCTEPKSSRKVSTRRTLIVDGNNVAHNLSPNGIPCADNLLKAYHSLTVAGYNPVIVVSAALKHRVDKREVLDRMIGLGQVIEVERGTNDDLHIIREAQFQQADIVSNDRFLDWTNRYPWVQERLRKYRLTPSGLILE